MLLPTSDLKRGSIEPIALAAGAPANFHGRPMPPRRRSPRADHASRRVDNVCRFSPRFRDQEWKGVHIQDTPRGPAIREVKAARVHGVDASATPSRLRERLNWLIVARNPAAKEVKYFVSNASGKTPLKEMLEVAFARWHIEKWFARAGQEAGPGAFEVRTYQSLIRHWLCSRMAMYFLAAQTDRLGEEKSADHARAGGRDGQRPGHRDLEPQLAGAG